MSRVTKGAVGALLAILLLWFFLRGVDLDAVLTELRAADYRWVLLAVGLTFALWVQRAWRWHYLLLPIKEIPLSPLTACTFMGWTFNTLLPGRLGEIARPVLLARREGISSTAAFATVVLERLFDLMAVLLMLVVYLLAFPLPAAIDGEGVAIITAMRAGGVAALFGFVVAVGFLAGAQFRPARTDALLVAISARMPSRLGGVVLPLGRRFLEGIAGLGDPRLIGAVILHSLLIWGNIAVTYYVLFPAFDIQLPFYATLSMIVLIVIGVSVPTPAAVGAFHAAVQLGLVSLWGVSNEQAVSYAIVSHAVAFGPVTVVGILLLGREGLSLGSFLGLDSLDNGESEHTGG